MGRPVENLPDRVQILQLKPHHRSMARDIVAMGEIRMRDLARIYNMFPAQISIIVNSPVFQAELARLEDMVEESVCEVRSGIKLLVPRAEQVLKEELFVENDELTPMSLAERKLRLGVARDIIEWDSGLKQGGGDVHYHNHQELHLIKQQSTEELRKSVFDLLAEE
jgi:hypothetical protein